MSRTLPLRASSIANCMLLCTLATAQTAVHEPVELDSMRQAAITWRDSLGSLTSKGTFAFDDKVRTDWHFVPKEREGVCWRDMNLAQRRAAHALLQAALSSQGYFKALTIMSLESELRRLEADRPNVENIRDPEKYWFAIFGDPSSDEPWGWRVEGHHLSLNFSSVAGEVVSATPTFFGSNPAEIRDGPRAGLRVMGVEEDLARELINSCNIAQRREAIISDAAPDEILTQPGIQINLAEPDGLSAAEMDEAQQQLLRRLFLNLANNFHHDLYAHMKDEYDAIDPDQLHFAWAGSTEVGQGHYYRLHGPSFVIEYDNTQNNANHAHLVWHATENDFGADFLQRHYRESTHHQGGQRLDGNDP